MLYEDAPACENLFTLLAVVSFWFALFEDVFGAEEDSPVGIESPVDELQDLYFGVVGVLLEVVAAGAPEILHNF